MQIASAKKNCSVISEEKQKHGNMGGSKISQFLKGAADGEVRNTSEQVKVLNFKRALTSTSKKYEQY